MLQIGEVRVHRYLQGVGMLLVFDEFEVEELDYPKP